MKDISVNPVLRAATSRRMDHTSGQPAMHIDPTELRRDIDAYRAGDVPAGDRLCTALRPPVRLGAARLLGDDDPEVDDVVQDTLMAGLGYLRQEREFDGDLVRLAVTIARNRCRDILRQRARRPQVPIEPLETWLAHPERSALDDLAESELFALLQQALDQLKAACRRLLHALYVDGLTPEDVRVRSGLSTVQGVYHRRSVCLGQARKLIQRQLRFGSWSGTVSGGGDDRDPGGPAA